MARLTQDPPAPFATPPAFEGSFADARSRNVERAAAEGHGRSRPSHLRLLRGAIAFATLCLALIALAWVAWTPVLDGVAEGASALAARESDGRTRVSVTVALLALGGLGFVLAWWRASHPRRAVRLSDDRGTMAVDVIAEQLRGSLLEIRGVSGAEVGVENRGKGRVRVHASLRISADARIDDVLDGVDEAADGLIQHRLGLLLSEPPLAEVTYDELDLRAARAAVARGHAGNSDSPQTHPNDEDA